MTIDYDPAPHGHGDGYCILESPELVFHVGIVGTGPGYLTMLSIIGNNDYADYMPHMDLCGVAKGAIALAGHLDAARKLGVTVYDNAQALLDAHPEINLIVELTGSMTTLRMLRSTLPPSISLVDHAAAVFLCSLHNMLQVSRHCQFSLHSQQAMLQAIVDEVRDDIMLLDRDMRVVDLNKNVAERTGRKKEDLIGKPCHEVEILDDGKCFCASPDALCPFSATARTLQNAEAMLTRVDAKGRLRYFRLYTYPILNKSGDLTHVLVMRRDITARTQRERNLQQTEKLAAIGEMSTYLAHEIRNPLFAIGGFVNSLLRSTNLSETELEKVKIIAEETRRLDRLLKSILGFVRPEDRAHTAADLNLAAAETVELMRIGYCHQGFELTLQQTPDLPKVRGEAEMIKQCLINLIKNSVEAMPGGGRIDVSTGFEGHLAILRVADNGPGIAASEMEKIFSPFYSTKEQGYGLGLAMIKKIVEEAGGHVDLTSREGQGTVVTLSFQPELAEGEQRIEMPRNGTTP